MYTFCPMMILVVVFSSPKKRNTRDINKCVQNLTRTFLAFFHLLLTITWDDLSIVLVITNNIQTSHMFYTSYACTVGAAYD